MRQVFETVRWADVEELVRSLVRQADGDVESAQYGIIYLDEVDKIAAASGTQGGRDVSGRGVQTNLLKLMEETEVPTRAPNDISGQFEMMMQMSGPGGRKRQPSTINTRHILFIVSGAFDGLEKIVTKRLREASIGFSAARKNSESLPQKDVFDRQRLWILSISVLSPSLSAACPVRVVCKSLQEDDLYQILKSSEGSIVASMSNPSRLIRSRFSSTKMLCGR
jgi:ATP-dependent protease Clp ATPase subunit